MRAPSEVSEDHSVHWAVALSCAAVFVNLVRCRCAAYRTQLFLYLKACGRDELGTLNLWAGVDPSPPL